MINKKQLLSERPKGMPNESTWSFVEETVAPLKEGEILVEQSHVSLDQIQSPKNFNSNPLYLKIN
jgi:hypothetical protein